MLNLTVAERCKLEAIVKNGNSLPKMIRKAQILLLANKQKQDKEIASLLGCSEKTVYTTRKAYCQYGLQEDLDEQKWIMKI